MVANHLGRSQPKMVLVLLAQNSLDLKLMVSVAQIFATETNSSMSGDTVSHALQEDFMTELVEDANKDLFFLPTLIQLHAVTESIDQSMVWNASIAQIIHALRTTTQDVLETNANLSRSKTLTELAQPAQKVQDLTSCKETALKSFLT